MNHNSQAPEWAASLIASIKQADEALDVEGFLQLLDEDVIFRLGKRVLTDRNTVMFEAEVTYGLKRGPSLTLPYVDVLTIGSTST